MKSDVGVEHSALGGEDPEEGTPMNELNPVGEDNSAASDSVVLMRTPRHELKKDMEALDEQDWDDGDVPQTRARGESLSGEPLVDIYSWKQCGYLSQYFVVGLIYGGE